MKNLNFPEYAFVTKKIENKCYIFDKVRKKFVALTPEEWVRQNMIEFLTQEKKYPLGRFANEITLNINGMPKRCDSIFYDEKAQPLIVIEYKAASVDITQKTFDQIATYNLPLKVRYLIVSNGINHFFCKINYQQRKYIFYKEIPSFEELMA